MPCLLAFDNMPAYFSLPSCPKPSLFLQPPHGVSQVKTVLLDRVLCFRRRKLLGRTDSVAFSQNENTDRHFKVQYAIARRLILRWDSSDHTQSFTEKRNQSKELADISLKKRIKHNDDGAKNTFKIFTENGNPCEWHRAQNSKPMKSL